MTWHSIARIALGFLLVPVTVLACFIALVSVALAAVLCLVTSRTLGGFAQATADTAHPVLSEDALATYGDSQHVH